MSYIILGAVACKCAPCKGQKKQSKVIRALTHFKSNKMNVIIINKSLQVIHIIRHIGKDIEILNKLHNKLRLISEKFSNIIIIFIDEKLF